MANLTDYTNLGGNSGVLEVSADTLSNPLGGSWNMVLVNYKSALAEGFQRDNDDVGSPLVAADNVVVGALAYIGYGNNGGWLIMSARRQDSTPSCDKYYAYIRSGTTSMTISIYRTVSSVDTLIATISYKGDLSGTRNIWAWYKFAVYTYAGDVRLGIFVTEELSPNNGFSTPWAKMLEAVDISEDKILDAGFEHFEINGSAPGGGHSGNNAIAYAYAEIL